MESNERLQVVADVCATVIICSFVAWFGLLAYNRVSKSGFLSSNPATLERHGTASARMSYPDFYSMAMEGHWDGPPDAPSLVTVFKNYGCTFSQEFHHSLRQLRDRYPQHLAVSVILLDGARAPHDVYSPVALGAECAAEQNRFMEYHNAAFEAENRHLLNRREGASTLAQAVGIDDLEAFDRCVWSRRLQGRLGDAEQRAKELGVEGVPTWFLNGERYHGAVALEDLELLIVREFRGREALLTDPDHWRNQ